MFLHPANYIKLNLPFKQQIKAERLLSLKCKQKSKSEDLHFFGVAKDSHCCGATIVGWQ